jgi:hypothetical protein
VTALQFVRKHGVVLQSAHVGDLPVLVDFIAGERVRGSWWGHAKGREIFRVLNDVYDSGEVVALRLIEGKVTLVHRRVWPALVALADEIGRKRLAAVSEEHTPSGKHKTVVVPFPRWVPKDLPKIDAAKARSLFPGIAQRHDQVEDR